MFIQYKNTGLIKEVSEKRGAMRIYRGDAVACHNAKSAVMTQAEKLLRAKYLVKFEKEADAGLDIKALEKKLEGKVVKKDDKGSDLD